MKSKKRLKKGPDIQDYVVECIAFRKDATATTYKYFSTRKEARDFEKGIYFDRVRIFRIKYTLVSDHKRK